MRLCVLYGSQTGTAQDVAEQIWRESKCWGFSGPVLPLDEMPIEQLITEKLVVFVVATTGNGDEPENMKQNWRFLLRRNLPGDLLQHLKFTCLGLGDSSYVKFNYAAKKLNKRLQQLGATSFLPLGLCDDQHDYGLSAVSLLWIEQLWGELTRMLSLKKLENGLTASSIFRWKVEIDAEVQKPTEDPVRLQWPLKETGLEFTLKENQRTTAEDHFQDVRFLRFDFVPNLTWNAGDILQVRPYNSDEQVAELFALAEEHNLNFTADTVVTLGKAYEDVPLPLAYSQPVTVGQLAKYVWDLNAKPRQRAFELLALNCVDELEKEKLEELSTAEGLESLIEYINRPRRTILEVLQDFRHATNKLTLPILFEIFPIIQSRSFSIASMPSSGTLDLLVAVVKYKTKLSTPRLGLCSNWLKSLRVGTKIIGSLKSGTMLLPKCATTPLIMVGPGTGIAPFRSVIQEREQLRKNDVECGKMVVFFGCRNKSKDFHFEEDLTRWQSNDLVQLFVAFSRDQEQKVYVQHLIGDNKSLLKNLIENKNAVILLAGSSNNMPKAVREAFIDVLNGNEDFVEEMIKKKRYQEETWS